MTKQRSNRAAWRLCVMLAGIAVLVYAGIAAMVLGRWWGRRPDRYLIPDGYVGWVRIEYGVKGAPALPIEWDDFYLVKLPPSGVLRTSTAIEYGVAGDEFYYYSGAKRRRLKETGWDEGGMIWEGHISGPPHGDDPALVKVPWDAADSFFVGTEVQWKEFEFRATQPSKREKEFYNFGMACGSQDGSRRIDEFAENFRSPPKGMVGAGKTQVYLAKLAGGIPGTEAIKRARTKNRQMAVAYKLHNLLIAAEDYPQDRYLQAFKRGYGIAQLRIRIRRHSEERPL